MKLNWWGRLLAVAIVGCWNVGVASAELAEYYIGIDGRETPFAASAAEGGGNYPDNPNFGRLTLLLNHGNHYHGIGAFRYTGPAASPTLEDTNANNRLPEISTAQPPLPLLPGSGVYAGKNTTAHIPGVEYSNLELQNAQSLDGVDEILFHSSSDHWSGAFDDAHIHLKLLSVSSPDLHVGSPTDPFAFSVGGDVHLGDGDEMFAFTPVLWVENGAATGNYWAEFQLIDLSGAFGDSGRFYFDVHNVVPEPASLAVFLGGVSTVGLNLRRRL